MKSFHGKDTFLWHFNTPKPSAMILLSVLHAQFIDFTRQRKMWPWKENGQKKCNTWKGLPASESKELPLFFFSFGKFLSLCFSSFSTSPHRFFSASWMCVCLHWLTQEDVWFFGTRQNSQLRNKLYQWHRYICPAIFPPCSCTTPGVLLKKSDWLI